MFAAMAAHRRGCQVTVIDEGTRPGGQIYRQPGAGLAVAKVDETGEERRKATDLDAFSAIRDDLDYRANTEVYAAFPGPELHVAQAGSTTRLRPDAVVFATGVRERVIPFPGWTLPGVTTAGGAQAQVKSHGVKPGKRAVVAGAGPLPLVVAAELCRAGVEVQTLGLLRSPWRLARYPLAAWRGRSPVREGLAYMRAVRRAGVEIRTGLVPVKAHGSRCLEGVTLAQVDGTGQVVSGSEDEVDCDLLALNYGFVVNNELPAMCGVLMSFDDVLGGWLPETDTAGRTSETGVYVAGDAAGLRGAFVARAEGEIVGATVASDLSTGTPSVLPVSAAALAERSRHLCFQTALRQSWELPGQLWGLARGDTIVCRCEHVTGAEIDASVAAGHISLNAIKRNTRCGMGWCGGRNCLPSVESMFAGHRPWSSGIATPRPVVRPVTLNALADHRGD